MNTFIWYKNGRYIQDQYGQIVLDDKPELSFEYEYIRYYDFEQFYALPDTDIDIKLNTDQIEEIKEFIANTRTSVGIKKLAVDSKGLFLGFIDITDPRVEKVVDFAPPTADTWAWDINKNSWERAHYYNAQGHIVHKNDAIDFTIKPMPTAYFPVKFSIEHNEWIMNSDTDDWKSMYRNKAISDVLVDYIHANLHVMPIHKAGPYLENLIKKMYEESSTWIEKNIDHMDDPYLKQIDEITSNFVHNIPNNDSPILIHGEVTSWQTDAYFLFKDYSKQFDTTFYKSKKSFQEEIVTEYLKEQ